MFRFTFFSDLISVKSLNKLFKGFEKKKKYSIVSLRTFKCTYKSSSRKYYNYRRPIGDFLETHRRHIEYPLETDMSKRRPIGDQHC